MVGRWRKNRLAALVAGIALVLCGCQQGTPANEVDLERLRVVQQDPVFETPTVNATAGPPQTSVNARTVRSVVYDSVETGDTRDPVLRDEEESSEQNWREAKAFAVTMTAKGWRFTSLGCRLYGEFWFLALKDYGTFTAAMIGSYDRRSARFTVWIPFHTDPPNPWQPRDVIELEDSCLAADEPPKENGELADNNYSDWIVEPLVSDSRPRP